MAAASQLRYGWSCAKNDVQSQRKHIYQFVESRLNWIFFLVFIYVGFSTNVIRDSSFSEACLEPDQYLVYTSTVKYLVTFLSKFK